MTYRLGTGSRSRLTGVTGALVHVVELAIRITDQDFSVTEGVRSMERQEELLRLGYTRTLNSRHITGHAVDLVPYYGRGVNPWPGRAPNEVERQRLLRGFEMVGMAMFEAADRLQVLIQWGNDWDMDGIPVPLDPDETFTDMPHYQIPWPNRIEDAKAARKRRQMTRGEVIS